MITFVAKSHSLTEFLAISVFKHYYIFQLLYGGWLSCTNMLFSSCVFSIQLPVLIKIACEVMALRKTKNINGVCFGY